VIYFQNPPRIREAANKAGLNKVHKNRDNMIYCIFWQKPHVKQAMEAKKQALKLAKH
jgi:hypothetical protein